MPKLSDLSDYELTLLLNTTVAEARKQREIFREHPDVNNPFAILDLTVEEFRQDYARGGSARPGRSRETCPETSG